MAEIIIAGAGHGGLVAAERLAAAGHSVTVFEKNTKENCGLSQTDFFDASAMEIAGIEVPEKWHAPNNQLTFVPLEDDAPSLTLPRSKNGATLAVDRRELFHFLAGRAEAAGVKFCCGVGIQSPIVLGSRVAGIKTDEGDYYGDLIIDACGVHSPLRSALPDFMHIEKSPAQYDCLHTFRACYAKNPSAPDPEDYYKLFLDSDGTVGFSWVITNADCVDVLIVRFPPITVADVEAELAKLRGWNPHIGTTLVSGGSFTDIPVRQPLAVLVADGYAAVGDSAFMTYAVKGSGIAFAVRAGVMLANAVAADSDCLFTADTLWEYQKAFFKEIGFDACRVAILKNLLPYLTAKELSDLFKKGFITSEELEKISSDGRDSLINSGFISLLREKIKLLGGAPEFTSKIVNIIVWLGKFAVTEPMFPNKYDREDVARWAARYTEVFESFRKK